jgi:FKBP-type peptidyl-prolyl cis-trans isomerase FklB
MKLRFAVALCLVLVAGQARAAGDVEIKTEKQKLSYSIGVNTGKSMKDSLKAQSVDVDPVILLKGLNDGILDAKPQMTEDEVKKVLEALQKTLMAKQQEQQAKQQEQAKAVAEKNKKDGEAFLAANKKKEGVVTMPSGLQYKILTAGKGKSPKATDTVTVNYKGTTIDGTEFDSSYKRGKPATFPLNQVIPGWTEAVQLMKEGAKWELYIPSSLAYGERGAGANIGGNATLIFEVELLSINK